MTTALGHTGNQMAPFLDYRGTHVYNLIRIRAKCMDKEYQVEPLKIMYSVRDCSAH